MKEICRSHSPCLRTMEITLFLCLSLLIGVRSDDPNPNTTTFINVTSEQGTNNPLTPMDVFTMFFKQIGADIHNTTDSVALQDIRHLLYDEDGNVDGFIVALNGTFSRMSSMSATDVKINNSIYTVSLVMDQLQIYFERYIIYVVDRFNQSGFFYMPVNETDLEVEFTMTKENDRCDVDITNFKLLGLRRVFVNTFFPDSFNWIYDEMYQTFANYVPYIQNKVYDEIKKAFLTRKAVLCPHLSGPKVYPSVFK